MPKSQNLTRSGACTTKAGSEKKREKEFESASIRKVATDTRFQFCLSETKRNRRFSTGSPYLNSI